MQSLVEASAVRDSGYAWAEAMAADAYIAGPQASGGTVGAASVVEGNSDAFADA